MKNHLVKEVTLRLLITVDLDLAVAKNALAQFTRFMDIWVGLRKPNF